MACRILTASKSGLNPTSITSRPWSQKKLDMSRVGRSFVFVSLSHAFQSSTNDRGKSSHSAPAPNSLTTPDRKTFLSALCECQGQSRWVLWACRRLTHNLVRIRSRNIRTLISSGRHLVYAVRTCPLVNRCNGKIHFGQGAPNTGNGLQRTVRTRN